MLGFRPPAPRSRSAPRTATMSGAAVRPFVSPSLDVIHHGWSVEAEEQAAASSPSPSLLTMTATFNPEIDVGTTEVVFVPRFAAGHARKVPSFSTKPLPWVLESVQQQEGSLWEFPSVGLTLCRPCRFIIADFPFIRRSQHKSEEATSGHCCCARRINNEMRT